MSHLAQCFILFLNVKLLCNIFGGAMYDVICRGRMRLFVVSYHVYQRGTPQLHSKGFGGGHRVLVQSPFVGVMMNSLTPPCGMTHVPVFFSLQSLRCQGVNQNKVPGTAPELSFGVSYVHTYYCGNNSFLIIIV